MFIISSFLFHKALKAHLDDLRPAFDDVNKRAQDLIGQGLGFDSAMVKQMADTDKEWDDVNDAAANQVKELEKALEQLEKLDEAVKEVDEAVNAEEAKLNELPPVGTDVGTINEQIEQIKVRSQATFLWSFLSFQRRAQLRNHSFERFKIICFNTNAAQCFCTTNVTYEMCLAMAF